MSTPKAVLSALEGVAAKDPERMHGILCFSGTRVPVTNLLDQLADGDTLDQFLEDFPSVTRDQATSLLGRLSCLLVPEFHEAIS